ncbi:hypothetical protein ACKI1L_38055, partial [Streptomyces scabiei]|uniref:hypothetical protein n=1 Tax=Streptomyces scabiei TaxID=1930 RepID=UPI0038F6521C
MNRSLPFLNAKEAVPLMGYAAGAVALPKIARTASLPAPHCLEVTVPVFRVRAPGSGGEPVCDRRVVTVKSPLNGCVLTFT